MEYIAFKSLISYIDHEGVHYYSPTQLTKWAYDIAGRPCLVADSMDDGHGIYAATWQEATEYRGRVYMVVPYLLDGDDPKIALGTHGWRSSAATVIAGPWEHGDKDGMRQAAEFILASYQQGYRQVDGILIWAAAIIIAANDDSVLHCALPILERAMEDKPQEVMRFAGEIGAPALPILERAMQDEYLAVRVEAVCVAGEIGASALPILELAVRSDDLTVRTSAMSVLRRGKEL